LPTRRSSDLLLLHTGAQAGDLVAWGRAGPGRGDDRLVVAPGVARLLTVERTVDRDGREVLAFRAEFARLDLADMRLGQGRPVAGAFLDVLPEFALDVFLHHRSKALLGNMIVLVVE